MIPFPSSLHVILFARYLKILFATPLTVAPNRGLSTSLPEQLGEIAIPLISTPNKHTEGTCATPSLKQEGFTSWILVRSWSFRNLGPYPILQHT